jgi:arginyl-tRNA synthetase
MARDERLDVATVAQPRRFVIDYSSPNVAKPMHVGHLRSTIIGDALTRLLRFLGHTVSTDNHLGDWGTQLGMLLYGYKHLRDDEAFGRDPVRELARLYLAVRKVTKPADEEEQEQEDNAPRYTAEETARAKAVLDACRQETVRLHEGDPENRRLWELFMPSCYAEIEHVYDRLGILKFDHVLGESFYNPMLADVVRDLEAKGIARESDGAVVVGDSDPPALVRKRDGAFTYTTTDLATIRYRVEQLQAEIVLYVVDFRQALHFRNLFAIARLWGYDGVELLHVSFGSVLGEDRRPLKTREGTAASLEALLDEAAAQAERVALENQEKESGEETQIGGDVLRRVAEVVGIGAVKYADLVQNRDSDYVFSPTKMTAMNGNTATYMQYAYARNRSIFRKGQEDVRRFQTRPPLPTLDAPEERALAVQLVRFEEALVAAAADYRPNAICAYLWDLAKTYSGFFQNCPVLKAPSKEQRDSRLLLCDLTARVIQRGLDLLGIRTLERM